MKRIEKILIANRGEISCRVISTCKALGIRTVSIYNKGEEDLPHVTSADEAVLLGDGSLLETYLNQDLLLEIAKNHNTCAIHPGYGLLSENASFARRVTSEGIIFIGPSPESIILMGDKIQSKIAMEKLGIPLVPGFHGKNQDETSLVEEAKKIGYPLLIKATAGGGGKGMRIVNSDLEFTDALASAKREAMNAFGNDQVLLEKYITSPRHIEIQVFSDSMGSHVHLYERECSIQRRYQKIVEESPSLALNQKLRREMTDVAVKISSSINYLGAGTIEFMLDKDSNFYFLEMNTRLQVEHPVTELVTGQDLVEWQIRVAEGNSLPLKQEEIKQNGHAVEVRIYAEDPDNDFLPAIGKLNYIGKSTISGVRCDIGYVDGNEVSVNFDPMCAKLIAHGSNRENAISKLRAGLNEFPFFGVTTNRNYLQRILKSKSFLKGDTFTHFVESKKEELSPLKMDDQYMADLIAFNLLNKQSVETINERPSIKSPWDTLSGLRTT
ncbi:MAG: ATP-grasp domain-containing protein [Bacteriovoracaceae bacterium]|jgi:acetyl/propionyl-CoA carboxylase alpha subunit|nr:ATP-grasp domain-containing protein [Bacteriovoracaceae bacterium]